MLNVVDWEKTNIYLLNKTCLSQKWELVIFYSEKLHS